MSIDLPESILPFFRAAGWPIAADKSAAQFTPQSHPASAILREFNGLAVGQCGAGEECASGDIVFGNDNDLQQDRTVLEWQRILSTTLVNIAEI